MPAVLSMVSDRVKLSQFRLSASIASSLIFLFHLRAGIRLQSLIRAPEPSSLAAQDSVQSHTRSHRPGSRRTKPAKTHYTTSFIKSHTLRSDRNAPGCTLDQIADVSVQEYVSKRDFSVSPEPAGVTQEGEGTEAPEVSNMKGQ